MKTPYYFSALAGGALMALGFTGCVENAPPPPQPVAQTVTYQPGYVVTTLPTGYTTSVYRGATYYTYNGVYYRTAPKGYVVVTSPY
jgi:hypothetical protein